METRTTQLSNPVCRKYIRHGMSGMTRSETDEMIRASRALSSGTEATGGYTVNEDMGRRIVTRMDAFPMRANSTIVPTTTGAALPWPTTDDTANVGELLAENSAMSEQDFSFGTVAMSSYLLSSDSVRVSFQLLDDTAFDLEGWLAVELGKRIGRQLNTLATTGSGSSTIRGITVGATNSSVAPTVGSPTIADASNIVEALDEAYLDEAKWMMNRTTWSQFEQLDHTTTPHAVRYNSVGQPILCGFPVVINSSMPAPTNGLRAVIFGDIKAAYVIRDAGPVQIQRMSERYSDYLQIGFCAHSRHDGDVVDAAACVYAQYST